MSFSLHVRKKYLIDYSSETFFNHHIKEIEDFISDILATSYTEDNYSSSKIWKIKKEDIVDLCKNLEKIMNQMNMRQNIIQQKNCMKSLIEY